MHARYSQILLRGSAALVLGGIMWAGTACQKTPPAPPPTPAPTPQPGAAPTVAQINPTYSGAQQMQYTSAAKDAFNEQRQAKTQAFSLAYTALAGAGDIGPKGLTSKEVIAARRALIATCIAANEDYLNFIKTQVDTYRAELAKTPLVPNDVNSLANEFALHANTDATVKLRQTEGERFKAGDALIAELEKAYGRWSLNDGKLAFKKKGDLEAFSQATDVYNNLVADEERQRKAITPAASAGATP